MQLRAFTRAIYCTLMIIAAIDMPHRTLAAEGLHCENFAYQEDAQQLLDDDNAARLDPDGNGVACEQLPSDGRPSEIKDSAKITIGYSPQFPVIYGGGYRAFLGGIGDEDLIENTRGVVCPEMIGRRALEVIFPDPTQVFLQDEYGEIPSDYYDLGTEKSFANALIWSWDGTSSATNLNVWLLSEGYSVYDPDTAPHGWEKDLKAAQRQAKADKVGIWGDCKGVKAYADRTEPKPQPTATGFVDSVSGDGSSSGYLDISSSGTYKVRIRSFGMDAYVESRTVDSDTGMEIPELSQLVFGPDYLDVWVYLEEGKYSVMTSAIGYWSITVSLA